MTPSKSVKVERHWKCKLGFHAWGDFYIRPHSSLIPWHGHARDCTREGCDQGLFYTHPPDGKIKYRNEDKT